MLKQKYIIPISFSVSIILVAADFFLFRLNPLASFRIHNSIALIIGIILVYASYKLIEGKSKNKVFYYAASAVGFAMVAAHITKLVVGNCL